MTKFIVTQTERYEVEAESMEKLREFWNNEVPTEGVGEPEYLDGSTIYEPIDN
jgi:hypothetical protein